jgi:hypothetical protein
MLPSSRNRGICPEYGPDLFPSGSHPFIKYWKTAAASIKIKKWMKK